MSNMVIHKSNFVSTESHILTSVDFGYFSLNSNFNNELIWCPLIVINYYYMNNQSRHYMAEILLIQHKTLYNQSMNNQSGCYLEKSVYIPFEKGANLWECINMKHLT